MGVEAHLDYIFSKAARDRLSDAKGKIFEYAWLDDNYQKVKSGKCKLIHCQYDKFIDCDMLTIKDIDSGEEITDNTFKIDLKLISE